MRSSPMESGPPRWRPMAYPISVFRRSLILTAPAGARDTTTEWLLFASGTPGRPKRDMHALASLTDPFNDGLAVSDDAVWSTFL